MDKKNIDGQDYFGRMSSEEMDGITDKYREKVENSTLLREVTLDGGTMKLSQPGGDRIVFSGNDDHNYSLELLLRSMVACADIDGESYTLKYPHIRDDKIIGHTVLEFPAEKRQTVMRNIVSLFGNSSLYSDSNTNKLMSIAVPREIPADASPSDVKKYTKYNKRIQHVGAWAAKFITNLNRIIDGMGVKFGPESQNVLGKVSETTIGGALAFGTLPPEDREIVERRVQDFKNLFKDPQIGPYARMVASQTPPPDLEKTA